MDYGYKFIYFISYVSGGDNKMIFGNCDITLNHPIARKEDVAELVSAISEKNGFSNMAILNYKLMRKELIP